jgi:hypothetical protein
MFAEAMVARLGAERHGIVLGEELTKGGATAEAVRNLVRRGVLVRLGRSVFRLRDHPETWEQRLCGALCLAGDGAVVGMRSAARLHGLYAYRGCVAIEIVRLRGCDHRLTNARLIQTRRLPASHIETVAGFPVTSIARTCFDLCGDPDLGLRGHTGRLIHEKQMARVLNDALARRGLTFVAQAAVLASLAKRGRSGTRLTRQLLLRFGPHYVPTESDAESLFAELLEAHGVPEPERQVSFSDDEGFIGKVDACWHRAKLIYEVDSSWHDGPLDSAEDARRDERLRRLGYTVERVHYGALVADPTPIIKKVLAILEAANGV